MTLPRKQEQAHRTTCQLVESWLMHIRHHEQSKARLKTDEQNLKEAGQALAKHLAPEDMEERDIVQAVAQEPV